MLTIRRASDRGHADYGWLNTNHTFSFGDYFDPKHHNYRALRVINDDTIAPGGGFPTHPHRDMEIITVMLEGRLAHKDSLGSIEELRPGEVQVMTAGTGISHSEFNPSEREAAKLLQIWILPERKGLAPSYAQKAFELKPGEWTLLASPQARDGSLRIHQDALVLRGQLQENTLHYEAKSGRGLWLHVIAGEVSAHGQTLRTGDAAAIEGGALKLTGTGDVLLFDLN